MTIPEWASTAAARASEHPTDLATVLDIARHVGRELPVPGEGQTRVRWAALTELARRDLTVARVTEAHTDALAIRAEAGEAIDDGRTWGVFAAESADARLTAERTDDGRVRLVGTKPWCSLGGVLDAGLVTAWAGDERQLFAVDLNDSRITAHPAAGWVSRGLPLVTSVGLDFDGASARPVGAPGWYLTRPGFAWGGIGVAACWYGGALALADALHSRRSDDLDALYVGRVDVALHTAACVLDDAATAVDGGAAFAARGNELALRTRAVLADAAETVLREVGQACGPAPLAFDEVHAQRVADLTIYLRQHHGERDIAALGRMVRARW